MTAGSGRLERSFAALAFAIPFGMALVRLASIPEWASDGAVGRALGGPLGAQGIASALAIQTSLLVPIGSVAFRTAWASALALGAIGWLVYALCRRVLARSEPDGALGAFVALVAALGATLPATPLREGTLAGGSSVAVLVALLVLFVADARAPTSSRVPIGLSALVGVLICENLTLAIAIAISLVTAARVLRTAPSRRAVVLGSLTVGAVAILLLGPVCVRWFDGGALAVPRPNGHPWAGPGAFAADMGIVALVIGLFGLGAGLVRSASRPHLIAPSVLVALDLLLARAPAWAVVGGRAGLDLAAYASLAIGTAVAVQAIAAALILLRLDRGRVLLGFIGMFDLALVVASTEEAAGTWGVSAGAERFADAALERLPARTVLLVRSEPTLARLVASTVVSGARPDVTIVPRTVFASRRASAALLDREPSLLGILRDMSIEGRPLERSMTALSDQRTLEVELDPAWDRPVSSHLVPDHLWLRFAPEPHGPSDRKPAYEVARVEVAALLSAGRVGGRTDPGTVAAAAARLKDCAALAAELGDKDDLARFITEIERITSGDASIAALRRTLSGPKETKGKR